ncbi:sugar phosphate isomerase/epimerase family protein [Winogradskyella sp.]|uniref:sugar phosphate isomerase/epimerase family protein n=2 Tax=Winogradskyella sp. TaxID=1883156 RepID=UPI003563B978
MSFNFFLRSQVGLQLYSLRNQFLEDIPRTYRMVRDWGFKYVEGGTISDISLEAQKKLLDQNGLELISLAVSYEELLNDPNKVIETAKYFESKYVIVGWIPHNANDIGFDKIKRATDFFNKSGKLLKKEGLRLAYHTHGYEFKPYKNGTLFDYMVQRAKDFTFEMDVFWVKMGEEDPLALLKKYSNKISLLHLKDRKIGTKSNNSGQVVGDTNVVLGSGDVGVKEIVDEAIKLRIEYLFVEDESQNVLTQIPGSLEYLQKIS